MTVTIQQILFATNTADWHRLAPALGLVAPYPPEPRWAEFHGEGRFAVHYATEDKPAGTVEIHLVVDDLDVAERALASFTVAREVIEDLGEHLIVRAASGIEVTIWSGAQPVHLGSLAVQPIWFQQELDEPRRILETLGLRPRIRSDSGGWVEFEADGGGLLALHHGETPRVGLSFLESSDLDALAARLRSAGFEAAVIDESFGRTVRLPDPDGGEELWINGRQEDLYGYERVE